MTDVLVYWPDFSKNAPKPEIHRWHSNHCLFGDLLPGDRLWVVTSGKSLTLEKEMPAIWLPSGRCRRSSGIRATILSIRPGNINTACCQARPRRFIWTTQFAWTTSSGRGLRMRRVPVGRFLRGPRRLTDEKVRQLRSAAGADIAQKWLTASKPANGAASVDVETSHRERQTR